MFCAITAVEVADTTVLKDAGTAVSEEAGTNADELGAQAVIASEVQMEMEHPAKL